jgi:hypothetical protein
VPGVIRPAAGHAYFKNINKRGKIDRSWRKKRGSV